MRDVQSSIADLLSVLVSEAKATERPELHMLSLACALENAAKTIRAERDQMETLTHFRCDDCGKHWGIRITVDAERKMWTPSNCPPCYNASDNAKAEGKRSGWTDTFEYLPDEKD